jgi:hypothetical protein
VFEGDAHALLMFVYKNPALDIQIRLDAARVAIKYEKPSLAAIQVQHAGGMSHVEAARRAELVEKLKAHMAKILQKDQVVEGHALLEKR